MYRCASAAEMRDSAGGALLQPASSAAAIASPA
jgi:hypothetical protein